MTTVQGLLNVARGEIGNHESPPNSNIQKYGQEYGMDGAPWCAMFISWTVRHSGGGWYRFASVASSVASARNAGRLHRTPVVGDVACVLFTPSQGHTGIVEAVNSDGTLDSIEGNTSSSSSRDGGVVQRRRRRADFWNQGFLTPVDYETSKIPTPPTPPQWGRLTQPAVDAAFSPGGSNVPKTGYWIAAADGGVFAFGNAKYFGGLGGTKLNEPIVGMSGTPDGMGYWLVARDGGVFAFGSAPFDGSAGGLKLNKPIVGMAATTDGLGYWIVASDGGIFSYGDAQFHGSLGDKQLNKPIVGMAATPSGKGYWLAASDGGVFAFGDATFVGSAGSLRLNKPVVGIVPSASGQGYWLIAKDGGTFAYGDAHAYGGTGALRYEAAGAIGDTSGLLVVTQDGGIQSLGSPPFYGSIPGLPT